MKKTPNSPAGSAVAMLATVVAASGSALAYIDAGSGSYIFQLLVGALVGSAVAVKLFWRRVFGFFSGRLSRKQ